MFRAPFGDIPQASAPNFYEESKRIFESRVKSGLFIVVLYKMTGDYCKVFPYKPPEIPVS
jgi:hypothetical protein